MSLLLKGCTRDDAQPHAADVAAAAADPAQGPGSGWQASSGACVQRGGRQSLGRCVVEDWGRGMAEDKRVDGADEVPLQDGDEGEREGGGGGCGEEAVMGVVVGFVERAERMSGGRQSGRLGEGSSRARGSEGDEGLAEGPWEVHERKKVRASVEQKGGRVGEEKNGVRVSAGVDVEEKVRLDEGAAGGSVRQVLHAWRCAVMAGNGAGEGLEEGEVGEWREGDCATVGLSVPDGDAALKVGDVDNVAANGVGEVATNGVGAMAAIGVGDVAANGVGDVAAIGVGDVAANGVGDIHGREGEEDPMEVDGECEEAVCAGVQPCMGEQCELDQHKVVLQGEGAHAGASSSVDGGASEIAALSSRGEERGGTCGVAAVQGVRKAQGGEQRVSVKQRLRVPAKYDDVPGTVGEVVEGSSV
ncbi:unnamed protein product [Closterium sp. NIES-53]